jgi:hypothetical protein
LDEDDAIAAVALVPISNTEEDEEAVDEEVSEEVSN